MSDDALEALSERITEALRIAVLSGVPPDAIAARLLHHAIDALIALDVSDELQDELIRDTRDAIRLQRRAR